MKYALYENPHTHRFALLPLPSRFADDDPLPISAIARWFNSREEAVAALPELLSREEDELGPTPHTRPSCAIGDSVGRASKVR